MRLGGRWGWLGDRETFRMVASALERLAGVDRASYFTLGKSSSRTEPPLTGYKSRIHNHAETLQDPTRPYKTSKVNGLCHLQCALLTGGGVNM